MSEAVNTTPAEPPKRRLDDLIRRPALSPGQMSEVGRSVAKTAKGDLGPYFQQNRKAIVPLLPRGFPVDRLLKIAQTVIRETPKLQECTVASLFGAVVKCATLGLEPNTHRGYCYLIPRSKSRPRKNEAGVIQKDDAGQWIMDEQFEVHVQIGTRGHTELAYRSPRIASIKGVAVCENDDIVIDEGTTQKITHRVTMGPSRGELIGCYAVATLTNGHTIFEQIPIEEIEHIRDTYSDAYNSAMSNSRAAQYRLQNAKNDKDRARAEKDVARALNTPWVTNLAEMGKGVALKRLCKSLPASPEWDEAVAIDGESSDLDAVLQGDSYVVSGLEPGGPKGEAERTTGTGADATGKEPDLSTVISDTDEAIGTRQTESRTGDLVDSGAEDQRQRDEGIADQQSAESEPPMTEEADFGSLE